MKNRLAYIFLFGIGTIIIIAFLALDLSNNADKVFSYQYGVPPIEVEPAPLKIVTDELYDAYIQDQHAADKQYKNKRIFLPSVEVTNVTRYYTLSSGEIRSFASSFSSGNIKFKLTNPYIMQSVQEGYIVDIVGECRGLTGDCLFIVDCWAGSVVGELGVGDIISFGY
jgi:hypothetical protein